LKRWKKAKRSVSPRDESVRKADKIDKKKKSKS